MDFRQNDIANAQAGTFEWFPKHKTFLAWIQLQRGLLWIKGKPGAGKSTLMKFARRIILEKITSDTIVISFFVHGRGSKLQKTPLGLFRSVLHQLLERFPAAVVDLVNFFKKKTETEGQHGEKWEWQEKQLQNFLRNALAKVLMAKPVVIFVDALDECGQDPAIELIDYFRLLLEDLPPAQNRIRTIFSCRHYPILSVDKALTIDLGDENYGDIKKYVWAQLLSDTHDDQIKELISNRANGVFLWAWLVVKRVRLMTLNAESQSAIKAKISSIPGDLRELYNALIQELMVKKPNQRQSLGLMQWVCFAQQPLTREEIQWALAVSPDCALNLLDEVKTTSDFIVDDKLTDRISTLSCGLVEFAQRPCYNQSGRIAQFIHQSVKDFLLEGGLTALGAPSPVMPIAHYQLGQICLQYLRLVQQDRSEEYSLDHLKHPLVHYALSWWTSHVRRGHSKKKSFREIYNLLGPKTPLLDYWIKHRRGNTHDVELTLLHVAADYGLTELVQWVLRAKRRSSAALLNKRTGGGQTALHIAAFKGNDLITESIIDTGRADLNGKDNSGRTPLFYAAMSARSHGCMIRLLGTGEVDIDSKDHNGLTPLSHAAGNGLQPAVQLLVQTDTVDVDSKDNEGRTPLSWAAQCGAQPVVQLLIETGRADIRSKDNKGRTPLSYAAESGRTEVVKLLIDTDRVDIDGRDNNGRTPLSYLAKCGGEAVVKLFIETGSIDVDSRDNNGRTPLSHAAEDQNCSVVQLLINIDGVDVDSKDKYGRTPLSYATRKAWGPCLQLILEAGKVKAKNDELDDGDSRALLSQPSHGYVSAVRLLLETGTVDVHSEDNYGDTPLGCAARRLRDETEEESE